MMREMFEYAENLSDLIENMQKSLQCIICLHTLSNAIRTRCGHRFCRECIQEVLQRKNAACPLCNSFIHRRNIREDNHIQTYIYKLSKLIEGIQKDISVDVSTHVPRPRSTRESCSSDNMDTAKPEQEDYNQPGCSYAQPKPMKPASSQAKRASSKSRRSKNGKTKNDNSSDTSSITKYFPKETAPSNYSDENSSELKIQSWLETLPDNMDFYNSNLIKPSKSNPNNTLVHSISQKKVSTIEHEPEHIATVRDKGNSQDVSSRDQKDEDGRKSMIKARESRRSSSTLTSKANEVSGRMQTGRVDRRQSTSSTGEDVVQDRSEDRTSPDIHKTSPCDLLPSTKKNWTSVVQFGREMRSRKKKIRSLNVSIENKNKKSTDEFVKEPTPKQTEHPRTSTSTRGSAEGSSVVGNDANEKSPVHKDRREQQPGGVENGGSMLVGESSFVELEQGEQVRIRNLNCHQMNDIIGIEDGQRELEIENRPYNDYDSERRFLEELGLCWSPSKRTKSSSTDVTPIMKSRENFDSPNLLDGYVSSSVETKTVTTSEPRPAAVLQSSTPLPNRLSLKRRDIKSTFDDPATAIADSRLLAVKRDLIHEIGRSAERCAIETKSKETGEKPDTNNSMENERVRDAETANKLEREKPENKRQEKSLVMFKKLGKVVKYRKKPCRFLYVGSTIRSSFRVQDRVERLQRLCNSTKLENPPKLMSANNAVSQDEGNLAAGAGREGVAVTERETSEKVLPVSKVLEIRSESPNSTVVSYQIPAAPKLNIESYDTLSKDIVSATVASELRDSNDILFVSIYEAEENGTVPVHQLPPPDNTTLERSIKMLSPKNDSQLKFLSLESPTTDTQPATKQQGEEDIVVKRSNLSDTRSVHSSALVRTSRQATEGLEIDATSREKKERSASRNNLVEMTKRTTADNDQKSKGATYTKDNVTKRKHDVESNRSVGQSTRHMKIVSLSSGSTTEHKEDASKEQKTVYKRIVPLVVSSSSNSKESNTTSSHKKETGLATKRKRSISPDSNSYNDVDLILNSWSKDLKPTDRFSRVPAVSTNKPNERRTDNARAKTSSTDLSVIHKRTAPFKRRYLVSSDTDSISEKPNAAMARDSSNKESSVETDLSNFEATIDAIRDIQRVMLATPVNDEQSAKRKGKEDVCLMHDNFDEIMANVDTENLIGDYCTGLKRKCDSSGVGVGRLRAPNKDHLVSQLHKGSDKENDYKESGRLYESESEAEYDKTLTPDHGAATDKSSSITTITDDRSRLGAKPVESTIRNNTTNRLSTINPMFQDSDKMIEDMVNDATLKEICFDQDSLMNITQHQMQIKQFEDDLFGRTANPTRKHENEPRTPQKTKSGSDLRGQDSEHSDEEDDIVENTPNVTSKNMPLISSSEKMSSTELSSVRRNMDRARSPSSTSERSTSSVYQRSANPLHQSTPEVQAKGQAKGDGMEVVNTTEKRLKAASTNEPMNRPANEVATINDQSVARQRFCFVCSGLISPEIEQVKRLASLANAGYVNQFDQDVTHVIVKANEENNGASKTLKYLQGIAHRKWIVSYQWVIDSLRKKKLINEERYEVVDSRTLEMGPRNSRLRQKNLFEGFTFLCIGPYVNVSVEQYEELLRATGGIVVDSLDALAVAKTRMKIVVIQADMHEYEIIGWYKKARAVSIVHDWIVECISQYKLISFYPYLQELLPADVLALGYPQFLLEDVPDDEDEDSVCDLSS